MPELGASLAPEVDVGCAACGGPRRRDLQRCRARRAGDRARASTSPLAPALARRARGARDFTHDYPTRLRLREVRPLYRSPRPSEHALLDAYEGERYAAERLPQMIASQRALFRPEAARARARSAGCARARGWLLRGRLPARGARRRTHCARARPERAALRSVSAERPARRCQRPWRSSRAGALRALRRTRHLEHVRPDPAAAGDARRGGAGAAPGRPRASALPARRVLPAAHRGEALPLRALAWNNLLGFPYLHGYGERSLGRLVREFGLTPTEVGGRHAGIVADRSYARWARLEERA